MSTCHHTISSVKSANRAIGHHFFSPDTMRFFRSRVLPGVYGCRFFVTSEQFDWDSPRLYTVREINALGEIDTVGEFQRFDTPAKARNAAKALAKADQWETCRECGDRVSIRDMRSDGSCIVCRDRWERENQPVAAGEGARG